MIEPNTKEYYELQSEYWFNECCKRMKERDAYKKQRDELINDMQEAKRKAEAFDEIKHIINENDVYDETILLRIKDVVFFCETDIQLN